MRLKFFSEKFKENYFPLSEYFFLSLLLLLSMDDPVNVKNTCSCECKTFVLVYMCVQECIQL